MHPAIVPAFGCAPLIPPRPEVTKTFNHSFNLFTLPHHTFPARLSTPRYLLPAFITVISKEIMESQLVIWLPTVVPCTIP